MNAEAVVCAFDHSLKMKLHAGGSHNVVTWFTMAEFMHLIKHDG